MKKKSRKPQDTTNSDVSPVSRPETDAPKAPTTLGICLGASNMTYALIEWPEESSPRIAERSSWPHDGNPKKALRDMVTEKGSDFFSRCTVSGRKFKNIVNLPAIPEPEAVELAYSLVRDSNPGKYNDVNVIVSAGGETFMAYHLDPSGRIIDVFTGNKCASGTGEFFLQQMKRIGVKASEAVKMASLDEPYGVAGRCSVFCKSDCTHALNKGIPKPRVIAGLCKMMATKIIELVKKVPNPIILLTGGTSRNTVMVDFLMKSGFDVRVPEEACQFEAIGAAVWAQRLPWDEPRTAENMFRLSNSSFDFLEPLEKFLSQVDFKEMARGRAEPGDECIIGLDVGSTTTKAILLRRTDKAMLGSIYLRTLGDPVGASRKCYSSLHGQLAGTEVRVVGLGVTGSGRQIAGLHALTRGVINEIIAHAAAAVHFDSEVDTIFEIGGQDAKYTYITNRVASDYAMNEACSAGTGSFLEESAKESLDISMETIGEMAMRGKRPPNFNDQCAAFISSDIKSAIQEGISTEEIVAGLVYSICMNYVNRVKGNRAVGDKVFMQGGVCYNKAVPAAMAALTGKRIVVPPDPGLMGAYGVALEIDSKLRLGVMEEQTFDLEELSSRQVNYQKPFVCAGGKEKCDRKCVINRIEVNDKVYPFGGACNKYYNLLFNLDFDVESLDDVIKREKIVFENFCIAKKPLCRNGRPPLKIAMNRSLLVNSLYPLFHNFFTGLGCEIVMPEVADPEGGERKGSAFCYPVELAHAFMQTLVREDFDALFLPMIKGLPVKNGHADSVTCPFVQSEPYYMKTAFGKELKNRRILTPVLNFDKGYATQKDRFIDIGLNLGFTAAESATAFTRALDTQEDAFAEMKRLGRAFLDKVNANPDSIGIVIFGRPYNAFTHYANMGIPHKFASRGFHVIPMDFLPYDGEKPFKGMYWSMGQVILKAARYVQRHPRLFGAFITNFSCGPDSFVVSFFRNVMGSKPSLTLELDSHTADAGVDTRIDAFLDVVKSYMEIRKTAVRDTQEAKPFVPATTHFERGKGKLFVTDSDGNHVPFTDPKVHLLLPTMGETPSMFVASAFRYIGVRASTMGPNTQRDLLLGRGNASCKECLPLQLTVGKLMNYLEKRGDSDEILVYFMPETSGPCRFGQYNVLIDDLILKKRLRNVTTLSLTSENSYAGMGPKFLVRGWQALLISDVLEDIYAALMVTAKNTQQAREIFISARNRIAEATATKSWNDLVRFLEKEISMFKTIPLARRLEDVPKVGVIGEIFVRRDALARQFLGEKLAEKGIMALTAPVHEWIYYCDYLVEKRLTPLAKESGKLSLFFQRMIKKHYERSIKKLFTKTGLYHYHEVEVEPYIENARHLLNPLFTGEAILTVGSTITDLIDHVAGIISIGPFGCMPNRVSEAIVSETLNEEKAGATRNPELVRKVMEKHPSLPFLSIESDGNVFPQVIEAKFESFCLQVMRLHQEIELHRGTEASAAAN